MQAACSDVPEAESSVEYSFMLLSTLRFVCRYAVVSSPQPHSPLAFPSASFSIPSPGSPSMDEHYLELASGAEPLFSVPDLTNIRNVCLQKLTYQHASRTEYARLLRQLSTSPPIPSGTSDIPTHRVLFFLCLHLVRFRVDFFSLSGCYGVSCSS